MMKMKERALWAVIVAALVIVLTGLLAAMGRTVPPEGRIAALAAEGSRRGPPGVVPPQREGFGMGHVYKVGQLVRTRGRNADRTGGIYQIVWLMPPGPDGVPQYRVKGQGSGERVVHENELAKA